MSPEEHERLEDWAKKYAVLGLLGFLSSLLIIGKVVHHLLLYRNFVCRVAVIPPAVVSGLLGLLWIFVMEFVDSAITTDLTNGLVALKITLVNFVFAAFTLGLFCSRTSSQHSSLRAIFASVLHEGMPMVIYSQILIWGQSCVCLFICCILSTVDVFVPSLVSAMVPLGIEAGIDVVPTAVYKNYWSQTVVQEAESLGLFAACALGVIAISVRRYYARGPWSSSSKNDMYVTTDTWSSEFEGFRGNDKLYAVGSQVSFPLDQVDSAAMSIPNPLSSKPSRSVRSSSAGHPTTQRPPSEECSLGTHMSVIFLSVFLSFNFGLFARIFESTTPWFQAHRILSGIRMFEMSIFCSVVIVHFIHRNTNFKFRAEWFMRLCGLMLDMLIIAAFSSALPRPQNVEQVNYGLVSIFVFACAMWNVAIFALYAKNMFPNFWFERGVVLMGESLGHSFVGILFARALDPSVSTPVPAAFACKLILFLLPSSGGKNTIVVSLVASHGTWVALSVCMCVVAAWSFIFEKYFKGRFVTPSKGDRTTMESEMTEVRNSVVNSVVSKPSESTVVRRVPTPTQDSMLEFDNSESFDEVDTLENSSLLSGNTRNSARGSSDVRVLTDDVSSIVDVGQLQVIASWLPSSQSMSRMSMRYSLLRDGASLDSLLAHCCVGDSHHRQQYTSCVIIIEDSWGYVFGGYVAHPLRNCSSYYGNGESFVFSLTPNKETYKWTGRNDFFVMSNIHHLAMGGGGGGFAFQLDDELSTGVSNSSETYDNQTLSSNEFFKCLNVEVWTFDVGSFVV